MTADDPIAGRGPIDPDVGLRAVYRVQFDEGTPDGQIRASALLRDAQDVAWQHSDQLGFDRQWYADRGLTWLVRGVELTVEARIPTGIDLAVITRITGYRRVLARRHTTFELPDGTRAAWARTDWVMLDRRGQPTRVPPEIPSRFPDPPPSFVPTRVDLPMPPDAALRWQFEVRRQDLDPLAHVNNAAYLDYVDEAVARLTGGPRLLSATPRTYRLEYLAAAEPNARIDCHAWPVADAEPATVAVRLALVGGAPLLRGTLVA
jgi:acyl-ACP thioesterase